MADNLPNNANVAATVSVGHSWFVVVFVLLQLVFHSASLEVPSMYYCDLLCLTSLLMAAFPLAVVDFGSLRL